MSKPDSNRHLVTSLCDEFFRVVDGGLDFQGLSATELVERHGSPLFVYDRQALDRKWERLQQALPVEVDLHYSIKANPNQTLLAYFLTNGCGLEVASGGELFQALRAGCLPERIIFAGPGKTDGELDFAAREGVGEIHVESMREARVLNTIAQRIDRRIAISLRVNPAQSVQGGAMRMGGKPSPFGIDEESLDAAVRLVETLDGLHLVGLHLFTGTQILDTGILRVQYEKGVEIAGRMAAQMKRPLETIDFGGGLGIPYFGHESPLDVVQLRDVLQDTVALARRNPSLAETRLILEPGRYLVGEAGVYVTRVIDVKESRGKTFVVTDGGMHHHLAASGNLGQTIKRNYPVALVNRLDEPSDQSMDVVGPLCTPLDVLARNVELPLPRIGDLFGVFQSGAYARSASPLGFLSHQTPAEVWVNDGVDEVIRTRGEYIDMLRDQVCASECTSQPS